MASYVPEGKKVPEWRTEPKGPPAPAAKGMAPYSDGSRINYDQPWPGDPEARPGTMSRVAQSLQQNVGNYLLYRATMDIRDIDKTLHDGAVTPPPLSPPGIGPGSPTTPSSPSGGVGPNGGHKPVAPNGGLPPGPLGLGTGPRPLGPPSGSPSTSNSGSAAPMGPSRSGQAPDRGIEAAKSLVNADQSQTALFPRDAFDGPIALGPRSEDRRPTGKDRRAKNRGFDQLSFDF